jgi:hypothetical protein
MEARAISPSLVALKKEAIRISEGARAIPHSLVALTKEAIRISGDTSQELQSFLLTIFFRKNNYHGSFSTVHLHINLKPKTSLDQDKSSRLMCNRLCK